ncbi:helix-turn-helix domain-containing protein [Actinomyces urinae]|uniref:helix-turn-helix domain-containing protein n=1 Tax=Actinomyces urinae TaxID=1689268 RepID=UPI00093084B4|nr:helix-turn-helix domain-containing protein [Actinomyces urinae]
MSVSWPVWARGVKGLTPSQSLVLFELARLADARGVAICAVDHLATVVGMTRRSVFRALAGLEQRGVLSRKMRYRGGKQASSRFVLHGVPGPSQALASDDAGAAGVVLEAGVEAHESAVALPISDNEGLRRTLEQAASEGWRGAAAQCLAATLHAVGPRQFSSAISKGMQFSRMSYTEAASDTCSIAWEVATTCTEQLIEATSPWAVWTTIVNRRCFTRDDVSGVEDLVEPSMMPEAGLRPGMGQEGDVWVSVDDFDGPLGRMVEALIGAGMSETLAWAGTLRIAELAVSDASRRHRAASVDPRLSDLGVTPDAGRAWMTMLVGSRRGVKGSILEADDESLALAAREVVEALAPAA